MVLRSAAFHRLASKAGRTGRGGDRWAASFELPKASAAVLTVGSRVAWDNTANEVTTPAAGRFPIGVAVEAAGNGVTSVLGRQFLEVTKAGR